MKPCSHTDVVCLNQYELIRKYQCANCNAVMMCACDKEHGERFLPHQLHNGHCLKTNERVPVTNGFQIGICPECRGKPPVVAPTAPMPGRTTKITRYYWREIAFETTRHFHERYPNSEFGEFDDENKRKDIEREVIDEIKAEHEISPKYKYQKSSQSAVIANTDTDIILVSAKYVKSEERKVLIEHKSQLMTVEAFGATHFKQAGYRCLATESRPFHVLFGILMSPVIQDPHDELIRAVQFGISRKYSIPTAH